MAKQTGNSTRAKESTFNCRPNDKFKVLSVIDSGETIYNPNTEKEETIWYVTGVPENEALRNKCKANKEFPLFTAYGSNPMTYGQQFSVSLNDKKYWTINRSVSIEYEDKAIDDLWK